MSAAKVSIVETRERILVLEDDASMRQSLVTVLQEEGYEVVAAEDGQEAVGQASKETFDLIIADVRMPGMDGLEALSKVREKQPSIHSMVVSGYSSESDSLRALRLGVGVYLRKPFQLETFLEAVQRMMTQRRQELALQAQQNALRRTALWAIETVAQNQDGLIGLGRRAHQMALECGLSAEVSEEVQMAALVGCLQLFPLVKLGHLLEGLPTSVRQIFELLEERWDGDGQPEGLLGEEIPLPARIASLLVRHRQGELDEGACDPALVALLRNPSGGEERPRVLAHLEGPQQGLLQLGKMLEESADPGALRAYEELLSYRAVTRESVEALFGIARLNSEQAVPRVAQACSLARQVSPTIYGYACLQAGLLLQEEGPVRLGEAVRIFRQLRLRASSAQAEIALALRCGGEVQHFLEILLEAPHHQELRECCPWLLPSLLRRNDPNLDRLVARFIRQSPLETLRVLARCNDAEKLVLARVVRWDGELLSALEKDSSPSVAKAVAQTRETLSGLKRTEPETPLIRLYTFGSLAVHNQDERVPDKAWANQKVKYLVAYLAERGGRPISEEIILDSFWPDSVKGGRSSLSAALSGIRKQLGDQCIVRSLRGIAFNPEVPLWQDLDDFQRLTNSAANQETEEAMEQLRKAVQLYRGVYLDGCYLEWALGVRSRCERLALEALTQLSAFTFKQQRWLELLEHAYRLVELDPCCQGAYLHLMQANMNLGRPEVAVRLFEQCRVGLRRELAMEPSIPLMEAHQRALLNIP